MKAPEIILLDIEIDKLINSIEQVATGAMLPTAVLPVSVIDLRTTTKKSGWLFNWRVEARQAGHNVFKLVAVTSPDTIQ